MFVCVECNKCEFFITTRLWLLLIDTHAHLQLCVSLKVVHTSLYEIQHPSAYRRWAEDTDRPELNA